MECRAGCGACCIAPSISQPYFGMPAGKPAGTRCTHLNAENLCALFGKPERPLFCAAFTAEPEFCGTNGKEALIILAEMEDQIKTS
ncbi:YkgJ family cysteine cluster protein [Gynuella sp.]|uniref:YkgJ family cysteine cluster protein n=1 Tax=Gynuella sp. TaxID=2969146 RepID=UPI003D107AC6